jgi:imidazolonepropionase-like amidohydrolase
MGMRPTDVLRSATLSAAELIGVNDRGTLAPGKRADIVAFNGDPTHDISLMEKAPAMILLGGKKVNAA